MIYFDHAATTPCSEGVIAAMEPFFAKRFGNPSSIYAIGRDAKDALCDARHRAADFLGTEKPGDIIFTSGATESNNLAVKGVAFFASQKLGIKPHIITSSVEHHCVLDSVKYLANNFGFEVTYLPVDKEGRVNSEDVAKKIKENTVLVSVMYGNNEMGALEPIAEIGKVVKGAKEKRIKTNIKTPLAFHTDAVQAFQYFDCNVDRLGVDLLSLTAHKFYGPKGVGLLYIRRGTKILPQQQGGSQEVNLRSGTENVSHIVGMVKAMELAFENRNKNEREISKTCDYLIRRVTEEIPGSILLGPADVKNRLPHIASFLFQGVEGESVLINLDMLGIAASSGSACTSGSLEPSHVTKAMGFSDIDAHGAIRFSVGKMNTKKDVDELMENLPKIVEKLRAMSPVVGTKSE